MLLEDLEKGKEVDRIIIFLAKAKSSDNLFDYMVSYDTDRKILGVFWKTGTMRQHCKDGLLDFIILDMMKCQINNANWPYFGPVMITGENVVVSACEDIFISETLAAYAWLMNSICSMLGLPCSVKGLVFVYGMLSANLLKDLGILDQYHLKEDWKIVGIWKRFSHLLIALIEAYAESEYMAVLENLRGQVESRYLRK